ncbi:MULTISPECIES: hypothetical protein [Burkholderiaceae]|jgi:hypothetical protein|uniref:Uncharacterized protein n=1 Tax=Caballeronia sordidicola TaxID=196367 RepID=A0A242MC59_CABSO|nr:MULTISPECIES: hypothetical protein [Burkholderiaceae]AMH43221.1 hypothetical protein AXG89_36325 [Burkholderia sp. PAMC 26561]OTP68323.1 hypothetical protein PAMC26577_33455 [Caballeronia sordidicola]
MSKLEAIVTSPPDRESVVFEILYENRQVAEISKEPGHGYEIEIYPAANNGAWHFDLNEFKAMLDDGIKELASNPQ